AVLACLRGGAVRRGQHHVREPRNRAGARDESQPDARAEADRGEHLGGRARDGELPHAHHRFRDDDHQASPSLPSSSATPSACGTSMNESEQAEPSTIRSESSRNATSIDSAVDASTVATIAPSMSVTVWGGRGSSSRPVIIPSAPTYDEPRMLPTSPS